MKITIEYNDDDKDLYDEHLWCVDNARKFQHTLLDMHEYLRNKIKYANEPTLKTQDVYDYLNDLLEQRELDLYE